MSSRAVPPPRWTAEELEAERRTAIEGFRRSRMEEPLERYLELFDAYVRQIGEFFQASADLAGLRARAVDFVSNRRHLEVVRYLAGPPLSHDDLKVTADVPSFSRRALEAEPETARRLIETVLLGLDQRRFPWFERGRAATEPELAAARVATATLMATRRAETFRRSEGKARQEREVAEALEASGFSRVPARDIPVLGRAPGPGEFCSESLFGERKADLVVGLWDGRVMAIECKVSNSATNSIKRLNNDAAAKAVVWITQFGTLQVIPSAVLSGVYNLHHLENAQNRGLTLFWGHDLVSLTDWIESTRP